MAMDLEIKTGAVGIPALGQAARIGKFRAVQINAEMMREADIPVRALKVTSGRPLLPEMRALGALIKRNGQPTNYGTIKVELSDEELENVGGLVIYTPNVMEVTLKK